MLTSFLLLILTANLNTPSIVVEYHDLKSQKEELAFIERYENESSVMSKAYVCSLRMKQAEYASNPITKLKIFLTYSEELDQLVINNPNNIHLRYVRLVIQENVPAMLGYSDHINEDKAFLEKKLNIKDATDYMDQYIKKHSSL